MTPLHYAAAGGHSETIKQLITPRGVIKDEYVEICRKDLSSKDSINTMMGLAAQGGHLEVMKGLHEEKNVPLKPGLMYRAYVNGSIKIMEWLKEKGVNPNVVAREMVGHNLDHSPIADEVNLKVTRWIVENIENPAEIYLSYTRDMAHKWDIKLILWAYGHNVIGDLGSDEYRQNAERFFAVKHCSIEEKIKAGTNLLRAIYVSPSISKELVKVIESYTNNELNNISPTSTLTDELSNLSVFVKEKLETVNDIAISNALINLNAKIEELQQESLAASLAQIQISSELSSSGEEGESKHSEEIGASIHQESGEITSPTAQQDTSDDTRAVVLSGEDAEVS